MQLSNSVAVKEFPIYDGSEHPQSWIRKLRAACFLCGITLERNVVYIGLLRLSRTITVTPEDEVNVTTYKKLLEFVHERDPVSWENLRDSARAELEVIRFENDDDAKCFTVRIRHLLYDADVLDDQSRCEQLLYRILPNGEARKNWLGEFNSVDAMLHQFNQRLLQQTFNVTVGSRIVLQHYRTEWYLSSSSEHYTTGSKFQMVVATRWDPRPDEYWEVLPAIKEEGRKDGDPIPYHSKIRLKHVVTSAHLHSHSAHKSPNGTGQEVCGFPSTDDNDHWIVRPTLVKSEDSYNMLWKMNEDVTLEHVITGKLLWTDWTWVKNRIQLEVFARPSDDNVHQRWRVTEMKRP